MVHILVMVLYWIDLVILAGHVWKKLLVEILY